MFERKGDFGFFHSSLEKDDLGFFLVLIPWFYFERDVSLYRPRLRITLVLIVVA